MIHSRCLKCDKFTGKWGPDLLGLVLPYKPHKCNGVDITPLRYIKMYYVRGKLKIKGYPQWMGKLQD